MPKPTDEPFALKVTSSGTIVVPVAPKYRNPLRLYDDDEEGVLPASEGFPSVSPSLSPSVSSSPSTSSSPSSSPSPSMAFEDFSGGVEKIIISPKKFWKDWFE